MDKKYKFLDKIQTPVDLKKLAVKNLSQLADEIRDFLINTLDITGGHFASSLGVLELSIAIHYVFDTPNDDIVWDVGHQTYIHKILTGRKDKLITIKKDGGISGFPKRSESEYDSFGVGHSSTSISAALGMAVAKKIQGNNSKSVAIIGDGAITGGMSFEALNHAGGIDANVLVILNDNDMSISDNVGGLTKYLTKMLASKTYNNFRDKTKKALESIPTFSKVVKKIETQTKGIFTNSNLFEDLGFYYVGIVDGHNIEDLVNILSVLKDHQGPTFLHVNTIKGKGYPKAENDPISFHHVSPNFHSGKHLEIDQSKLTYSNIFSKWICDKAKLDNRLVGITPAMKEGSDLITFSKMYPDRYFDVAIAEQHAVTFAAGIACNGLKPVVAIYSTFLQRAYDQVIHDVSIQNIDVLYAVDRAGIIGADGATHSGSFDLSFMRCIPNNIIMTPSDENECYHLLNLGYEYKGPAMVRYPRGFGVGAKIKDNIEIKIGKSNYIKKGQNIAILNFGTLLPLAMNIADKYNLSVIDMRFVKPLDTVLIDEVAKIHSHLITLEENSIQGGAGSAVNEYLFENNLNKNITVKNFGLPDLFLDHGSKNRILDDANLSHKALEEWVSNFL